MLPSTILAGGAIGAAGIGAGSQRKTNEAMMDFAKEMSSTQYQRAVEDMRAAGINPVMAAGQGGASSPTAQLSAPGGAAAGGLAAAAKTLAVDIPQAQANIDQQTANTAVAKEVKTRTQQETELTKANTAVQRANAKIQNAQVPEAQMKGEPWRVGQGVYKDLKEEVTKPREPTKDKTARWKREEAATKSFEQGKGTVYGGKHSAKSVTTGELPKGRGSIQ